MRKLLIVAAAAMVVAGLSLQSRSVVAQGAPAKVRRPGWEYKVVMVKDLVQMPARPFEVGKGAEQQLTTSLQEGMNQLGGEGWELCQEVNGGLIFKRPN